MYTEFKHILQNLDAGFDSGGGATSSDTGEGADTNTNTSNVASVADALTNKGKQGDITTQESLLTSTQTDALNFPEKYTVKNEDGTINTTESTRKLLDGYSNLSKKMGETGGVVPDSAEGYKIEFNAQDLGLPEGVTPELVQKDEDFKQFAEEAHKAGFTNEQINLVAGRYLSVVQSLLDRRDENDMNACKEALMKTWTTPDEMNLGIQNAVKAFNHFASEQDKALIDTIGNNPLVVRVLANVGAIMREDSPARNTQPTESRETITALMKSEAYQDPKHQDHERVYNQVAQYYHQTVGED